MTASSPHVRAEKARAATRGVTGARPAVQAPAPIQLLGSRRAPRYFAQQPDATVRSWSPWSRTRTPPMCRPWWTRQAWTWCSCTAVNVSAAAEPPDAAAVPMTRLPAAEFGCSVSVPTLRVLHVPPFSESGARAEQVSSLVNEASKSVGTNLALLLDTAVRGQRGALGLVCLRSRPLMERQVELGVRSTGLSPRPSRWRASPS